MAIKPQRIGREYIEGETPEEIERAKKGGARRSISSKKVKDHHKGRKPVS